MDLQIKGEGSKNSNILWMSLTCRINSSPRGRGPERRRIAGVHIKVKEMGKGVSGSESPKPLARFRIGHAVI